MVTVLASSGNPLSGSANVTDSPADMAMLNDGTTWVRSASRWWSGTAPGRSVASPPVAIPGAAMSAANMGAVDTRRPIEKDFVAPETLADVDPVATTGTKPTIPSRAKALARVTVTSSTLISGADVLVPM